MNDYKELLGDIADCLITHPSEKIFKTTLHRAYDAIEHLVKERNAAVADLNIARSCLTCKSNGLDFCEGCDSWASKRNWEWRGVKND